MLRPRGQARPAACSTIASRHDKLNVLITGPLGVAKSYLSCALGQQACREDASVRYLRLPRLGEELARADAPKSKSLFFKHFAKFQLPILDDSGLTPLADATQRDLLEIIDYRFGKTSTLVISQLPVPKWHEYLGNPTLADAILDRLVHNAYTIELQGESMRRKKQAA